MPRDFLAEIEESRKQQIKENFTSASKSLIDLKQSIKRLQGQLNTPNLTLKEHSKIYDQISRLEPQVRTFEMREETAKKAYEKEFTPKVASERPPSPKPESKKKSSPKVASERPPSPKPESKKKSSPKVASERPPSPKPESQTSKKKSSPKVTSERPPSPKPESQISKKKSSPKPQEVEDLATAVPRKTSPKSQNATTIPQKPSREMETVEIFPRNYEALSHRLSRKGFTVIETYEALSHLLSRKGFTVIEKLHILYDDWSSGRNFFALIEANYLIDYYCTQVLYYENTSEIRKLKWFGLPDTLDEFKHIDYQDGLTQVKRFILGICDSVFYKLYKYHTQNENGFFPINWDGLLASIRLEEILLLIDQEVEMLMEYSANAYGFYRVFALTNQNQSGKLPYNCTIKALLCQSVLMFLGFPRDMIFSVGQRQRGYKARKKQSHWAMTCKNPFSSVIENMKKFNIGIGGDGLMSIYSHSFQSVESFATYTRDIIFYYIRQAGEMDYSGNTVTRYNYFEDLVKEFDRQFPSEKIKSPLTSPTDDVFDTALAIKSSPIDEEGLKIIKEDEQREIQRQARIAELLERRGVRY